MGDQARRLTSIPPRGARRRRALFLGLVGLALAGVAVVAAGRPVPQAARPSATLRAGAARIDITPAQPVALEGYLNPEDRISEGVHDRLQARAFAFASGPTRVVLVSADLGSFMFGAYFQRVIAERLGLRPEEILLCATHTHSGPQLSLNAEYPHPNNARYTQSLAGLLATVAGRALRTVAPVRLRVGRSASDVAISRRLPTADGGMEMAPNPGGAVDREVLVLQLERPDGEPFGLLFNYACHSRSLRKGNRLVTGDVLGIAEQAAEREHRGTIAAAFAGTSGDIDPVRVVDGFDVKDGDGPVTVVLGTRLGEAVGRAAESSQPVHGPSALRVARLSVPLPSRHGGQPRRVEVTAVALGPDVAFVAFECEASVEVGRAIKAQSPFPHTFVFTLCNGWGGYLPVAHQYAEGGYEVARTSYAKGAAEMLVAEAVRVLGGLRQP